VKSCDEQIAQENNHLKLEVKRLEQMVSNFVKQAKVRHFQDNRRNMVNMLEKGSNITKKLLNHPTKLNLSRSNKRPLKKRSLSMQEVHI
jgi:hypothetical protein